MSHLEQILAQLSNRFDGLVRRFDDVESQIIDVRDGLRRAEETLQGQTTVLHAILERLNSGRS